jgi:hypothetical protein
MIKTKLKKVILLIALGVATGRAISTPVESNKAASYPGDPKRIFVITDIGTEWGKKYADAFQQKMTEVARTCGANTHFFYLTSLELEPPKPEAQILAFHADAVLSIRRDGGVKDKFGNVKVQNYDIRLLDVKTDKLVWRARVNFSGKAIEMITALIYSKADDGEALASDLTDKMKADLVFRTCSNNLAAPDAPAADPAPVNDVAANDRKPVVKDVALQSSIDLPEGWVAVPLSAQLKEKHFSFHASNSAMGANLLISTIQHRETTAIQKYAESLRSLQMNAMVNGSQSDISTLTVNDMPAWRFTVQGTGKTSGKDVSWLITVIDNGSKISVLNVYAPSSHFAEDVETYGKLAALVH